MWQKKIIAKEFSKKKKKNRCTIQFFLIKHKGRTMYKQHQIWVVKHKNYSFKHWIITKMGQSYKEYTAFISWMLNLPLWELWLLLWLWWPVWFPWVTMWWLEEWLEWWLEWFEWCAWWWGWPTWLECPGWCVEWWLLQEQKHRELSTLKQFWQVLLITKENINKTTGMVSVFNANTQPYHPTLLL